MNPITSLTSLSGTQSSYTPQTPAQQTTIILPAPNLPTWIVNVSLRNDCVVFQKGAVSGCYSMADLFSAIATLVPTLTYPPQIISAPKNLSTTTGNPANFSVGAECQTTALSNAQTYQWQLLVPNGAWANITNGGGYSGATASGLTYNSVTTAMNAYQYRCIVTSPSGSTTTQPATLSVPS